MRVYHVVRRFSLFTVLFVIALSIGLVNQAATLGAPPGPEEGRDFKQGTPVPRWFPVETPPPSGCGVLTDFERFGHWKRGDEPYGIFEPSGEEVHGGRFSGKLSYHFPTPGNDYVVFLRDIPLDMGRVSVPVEGQPVVLTVWVYGDGSGHFLNSWVKDADGEVWSFPFGQIEHEGWRQMAASLDVDGPWPTGHLSGPANGVLDYPLRFWALVLDDAPDTYQGSGAIYVDDLHCAETVPESIVSLPDKLPTEPGRITFFRTEPGESADIYVIGPDGSGLVRLTDDPAEDRDPAWSPDGSRIVFSSSRGGTAYDLYVMNADGSGVTRLAHRPDFYDQNPAWSPDGNHIAFESISVEDGNPEVYVMNADGSGVVRLTNKPGADGDPSWSPDSGRIVYYSTHDPFRGPWELWVMNADGSGKSQLTMGNDYSPAWSPDGGHIAHVHERPLSGNAEIAIMDVNSLGQVLLTNEPTNDMHPTWSPDGQRLAFLSYRDGAPAIYIMNQDGSGLFRLTEGRDPSWSPAGGTAFPLFGPLVFSDEFDEIAGEPLNVGRAFPYGAARLYAFWAFRGIQPGTTVRYDWYLDGVPVYGGEDSLIDEVGHTWQWIYNHDGLPLEPGVYQFVVRAGGRIVLSEQCSVLGAGETSGIVPLPPVSGAGCGLTLLEPDSGSEFGPATRAVTLRWELNRSLEAGEYFFVNVPYPHQGTIWYDGTWRDPSRQLPGGTRDFTWTLREYLCSPGFSDTGRYDWYVEVRQQRGPEPGLSDPVRCRSDTWSFRWMGCAATPTPIVEVSGPYE